jgi:hypothetical protein
VHCLWYRFLAASSERLGRDVSEDEMPEAGAAPTDTLPHNAPPRAQRKRQNSFTEAAKVANASVVCVSYCEFLTLSHGQLFELVPEKGQALFRSAITEGVQQRSTTIARKQSAKGRKRSFSGKLSMASSMAGAVSSSMAARKSVCFGRRDSRSPIFDRRSSRTPALDRRSSRTPARTDGDAASSETSTAPAPAAPHTLSETSAKVAPVPPGHERAESPRRAQISPEEMNAPDNSNNTHVSDYTVSPRD